jgi:hypothetical protein
MRDKMNTTTFTKKQMAMIATAGYTASQLLEAGYTALQLLKAGITALQLLEAGYTASQLLEAGITALQLLEAGYTASQLLEAGITASQLLEAGYTASQLLEAGITALQLLEAGYTASQLLEAGITASQLLEAVPKIDKPYTTIFSDLNNGKRAHDQSSFGTNVCGTPMCIAGHLVNLAGEDGWVLKNKVGFSEAAALIHAASHPDKPCPNFGSYPDEWALAFIEEMAAFEAQAVS